MDGRECFVTISKRHLRVNLALVVTARILKLGMSVSGFRHAGDQIRSEYILGEDILATPFAGNLLISTVHADGSAHVMYHVRFENPDDWLSHHFVLNGPPGQYPIRKVLQMRTRCGCIELKLIFLGLEHEGAYWLKLSDLFVPGKDLDPAVQAYMSRRGSRTPKRQRRASN